MKTDDHVKRWILPEPISEENLVSCNLDPILQKVLLRRGIDIHSELNEYLIPSELPNPELHFNQLSNATHRIIQACKRNEKIAICGDYDADGITSTVLLVELLSLLGAKAKAYIPSRQDEGYGLNLNMINDINSKDIKLIITVDNGVSAFSAIEKSNEYGIDIIITDHHKIPDYKLDIFSLIHPDQAPTNSPYKYLAGVGIAYLLATNICKKLDYDINNTTAKVLFCIGTVADMAPLKGANRKWLKEFIPLMNTSHNKGIKSIFERLSIDSNNITSEDIGYKIAPLINSVGRIGDPKIIIDLLLNDSTDTIEKLTKECFTINSERKRITSIIEQEALEIAHYQFTSNRKFLVISNRKWHTGVIGIVAARMADKFNLPTAVLAEANDGNFRGSIRSNNRLMVNLALDECKDLLISHGGHSSAAGFSIKEDNIQKLKKLLNNIAIRQFKNVDLNKSIKPDANLQFKYINIDFYRQLTQIGPFGIMNPNPIFCARKCNIVDIYKLKGDHIKMIINDGTSSIEGIKWNSSLELKINDLVDIAFYIEINKWKKTKTIQLNIIDIKKHVSTIKLKMNNHVYECQITDNKDILITNSKGLCFSSDISKSSANLNPKQIVFAKKILTFAEIALGKAA